MATEDPTNLLNEFRGSYGRLCHLTCKALHDGEDKMTVHRAFNGDVTSPLTKILTAHGVCHEALKATQPRIPMRAIHRHALEIRVANEREWGVEIDAKAAV